jgi:uncharacterized membrane protein (UPF0127 family)
MNPRNPVINNLKMYVPAAVIMILLFPVSLKSGPGYCDITFINDDNKKIIIHAEIADTEEKRSRGLMFRKNMKSGSGMIFVFPGERQLDFWMKDTYIPLSIAFVSSSGEIVRTCDMKPLDISITYPSIIPAQYAIEVNMGWFRKHNISRGCRVIVDGCIGK